MDPDKCLEDALDLVDQIENDDDADDLAVELAERLRALDDWIGKGGFLPARWRVDES